MRSKAMAIFICITLLCSCAEKDSSKNPKTANFDGFVPSFSVTGDVSNTIVVDKDSSQQFSWTVAETNGQSLPAITLQDVIKASQPNTNSYSVLLVGVDGLVSQIDGSDLTDCYIAYSSQFAWECVNYHHPISSKIKMLHEIVVVSSQDSIDYTGVGLLDAKGTRQITAGNARLAQYTSSLKFEGKSQLDSLYTAVYTPHKLILISQLFTADGKVCVTLQDGKMSYETLTSDSFIEIKKTTFGYGKDAHDIAGIIATPPVASVCDTAKDALHLLEKGENVLVIELDGWGLNIAQAAINQNKQPFLSSQKITQAVAVFPPISPVGLASMLTGVTPDIHGIHDRENKQLQVADIFEKATVMGKTSSYIEGDTSLVNTSIAPILSPDLDGKNGTDNEVYDNATKAMEQPLNLLFVHFHGIDDVATSYGPLAKETMDKTQYTDKLVSSLVQNWQGKVIITADHGLHQTQDGGQHGSFCSEDMLVPYIITTGGKFSD